MQNPVISVICHRHVAASASTRSITRGKPYADVPAWTAVSFIRKWLHDLYVNDHVIYT
ncbi:MAG: hypothetical protein J6B92_09540 [Paraprevotella sp.]|nr:hypothetical protein [Paraprevotella sp.]